MRHRFRFLILGLVVALAVAPQAVSYIAFEQIAVAGTAIGFTAAKITPNPGGGVQATDGMCRNELAEIRYTIDGTTPTSTVGTPIEALETFTVAGHDSLVRFLAIRTTGVSAQLDCTYSSP